MAPLAFSFIAMQIKRILMVGYGSIGQGLTPLLFRHFDLDPKDVQVVTADNRGRAVAEEYGINFAIDPVTPSSFLRILNLYGNVDVLINVSVDVSSYALAEWCQENGVMYIDTCVEPWEGMYDPKLYGKHPTSTNYALRESILSLGKRGTPTALVAHGANPGLVSHFVRAGLRELAERHGLSTTTDYAHIAQTLGVKVLHIAERDTQDDGVPRKAGEFKNTWSVDGFISEAFIQYAEMGWGTHEKTLPANGKTHSSGCQAGIYLTEVGANVKVKSWVPTTGEQTAVLITHHEAISIANMLTHGGTSPTYRPTVYYAYHPCDAAIDSMAEVKGAPEYKTVIKPVTGYDELGVLFVYAGGAYWYGSTLTCAEAAKLTPHNSATTLQVTATLMAALKWMEQNPQAGIVEAEDVDFQYIMALSLPYLGHVRGVQTDWQPHKDCALQFTDFLQK